MKARKKVTPSHRFHQAYRHILKTERDPFQRLMARMRWKHLQLSIKREQERFLVSY